jgi:hypothetical protein
MDAINSLAPEDVAEIQQTLFDLGYYDGRIDGVWAAETAYAYSQYWMGRDGTEIQVPLVAPAPAKPWWESEAMWGAITTVLVSAASLVGYAGFESEIAALVGAVGTLITGFVAFIGTKRRTAPIDQKLVARVNGEDFRLK